LWQKVARPKDEIAAMRPAVGATMMAEDGMKNQSSFAETFQHGVKFIFSATLAAFASFLMGAGL
jgi:hypothetical protein